MPGRLGTQRLSSIRDSRLTDSVRAASSRISHVPYGLRAGFGFIRRENRVHVAERGWGDADVIEAARLDGADLAGGAVAGRAKRQAGARSRAEHADAATIEQRNAYAGGVCCTGDEVATGSSRALRCGVKLAEDHRRISTEAVPFHIAAIWILRTNDAAACCIFASGRAVCGEAVAGGVFAWISRHDDAAPVAEENEDIEHINATIAIEVAGAIRCWKCASTTDLRLILAAVAKAAACLIAPAAACVGAAEADAASGQTRNGALAPVGNEIDQVGCIHDAVAVEVADAFLGSALVAVFKVRAVIADARAAIAEACASVVTPAAGG